MFQWDKKKLCPCFPLILFIFLPLLRLRPHLHSASCFVAVCVPSPSWRNWNIGLQPPVSEASEEHELVCLLCDFLTVTVTKSQQMMKFLMLAVAIFPISVLKSLAPYCRTKTKAIYFKCKPVVAASDLKNVSSSQFAANHSDRDEQTRRRDILSWWLFTHKWSTRMVKKMYLLANIFHIDIYV